MADAGILIEKALVGGLILPYGSVQRTSRGDLQLSLMILRGALVAFSEEGRMRSYLGGSARAVHVTLEELRSALLPQDEIVIDAGFEDMVRLDKEDIDAITLGREIGGSVEP